MSDEVSLDEMPTLDLITITWDDENLKATCDLGDVGIPIAKMVFERLLDAIDLVLPAVELKLGASASVTLDSPISGHGNCTDDHCVHDDGDEG